MVAFGYIYIYTIYTDCKSQSVTVTKKSKKTDVRTSPTVVAGTVQAAASKVSRDFRLVYYL